MSVFRFRKFSVKNEDSAMKVGTDAVLLGAAMNIPSGPVRLLDVGCGTGVISLMAAQRNPGAEIYAIDIDRASAGEAAHNFALSPWTERLTAICTPLSRFAPERDFELIFSNPPYYDTSLRNPDAREAAARHTESLSYKELCAFASEHLSASGRLSMILPSDCERELLRCAASFGLGLERLLRVRSTPNKPFSRIMAEFRRVPSASRLPAREEELTLLLPDGEKSPEYRALTLDFYL